MIGWVAVARAADGHLDAIVGVRSQPDAALEQPAEWEPELEPEGLVAVVGSVAATRDEAWAGLNGSAWGMWPESDPDLLALGPRAGVGAGVGPARLEIAGRYDAQWYPRTPWATNGRAEGLATVEVDAGAVVPRLSIEGIDRRYQRSGWSFSTAEADAGVRLEPGPRAEVEGSVGVQANTGGEDATGSQLRVALRVGWNARRWGAWTAYQWIDAFRGEEDEAERSQFTPLGDYVEDADALSGGGFSQHRVEVGGTLEEGAWTVRASALGRLRDGPGSYDRTAHGQVDLERVLRGEVSGLVTVGVSTVHVDGGPQFTDVYGWTGLSWRPR